MTRRTFKEHLQEQLAIESKAMEAWMAVSEAAYAGNIGFEEMVRFYQKADPAAEKEMEHVISKNDWEGYKKLIKRVLGISLK